MRRKDDPAAWRMADVLLPLHVPRCCLPVVWPCGQCPNIGDQVKRLRFEVLAQLGPPLVLQRGGADNDVGKVGDAACLFGEPPSR